MKVVGFTFIRNAVVYDYPIVEAISSILPLCDEVVVAVGASHDNTLQLIEKLNDPRIRIIHTVWDDSLREGGLVLANETNKAFDAIADNADWCFYIQGDEVVHEKYHPEIRRAMEEHRDNEAVEGLLFKYLHFYGSYDYVGDSRKWYRREVRIVRRDPSIRSYRDAQGFQKSGKPLKVVLIDAFVYHYGWVKNPALQQAKQLAFNRLWHTDEWIGRHIPDVHEFDYTRISHLARFTGTHPQVMKERVAAMNWTFSFDPLKTSLGLKNTLLHWVEKKTGWRIGEYRNYRIV